MAEALPAFLSSLHRIGYLVMLYTSTVQGNTRLSGSTYTSINQTHELCCILYAKWQAPARDIAVERNPEWPHPSTYVHTSMLDEYR
jgi:hypothetical protein